MRIFTCALAIALFPAVALGAEPDWAYPVAPDPVEPAVLKRVPGSPRAYTQAQIDDGFNPPDWFPVVAYIGTLDP